MASIIFPLGGASSLQDSLDRKSPEEVSSNSQSNALYQSVGAMGQSYHSLHRCDSMTSEDQNMDQPEPKSGSSTLTSSSEWSTTTCVPNLSRSNGNSLHEIRPGDTDMCDLDSAEDSGPQIELQKPKVAIKPFVECDLSSPSTVDTIRIASPLTTMDMTLTRKQKCKEVNFSTFGYGPDGKLDPTLQNSSASLIQEGSENKESTHSVGKADIQQKLRASVFSNAKHKDVVHSSLVPANVQGLSNGGLVGSLPRQKRIGSSGSSSITSFSETDDSDSHSLNNSSGCVKPMELLTPFHHRMGSNTSSGVSSVSQDSLSPRQIVRPSGGHGLVSKLVNNFQNTSLDDKPVRVHGLSKVPKRMNSNSSGVTSSNSDTFSASDIDSPHLKHAQRSLGISLPSVGRIGSSGSINSSQTSGSHESDLSPSVHGSSRDRSRSFAGSSRGSTSQESDLSSYTMDYHDNQIGYHSNHPDYHSNQPDYHSNQSNHHRNNPDRKNVSFENSGMFKLFH